MLNLKHDKSLDWIISEASPEVAKFIQY